MYSSQIGSNAVSEWKSSRTMKKTASDRIWCVLCLLILNRCRLCQPHRFSCLIFLLPGMCCARGAHLIYILIYRIICQRSNEWVIISFQLRMAKTSFLQHSSRNVRNVLLLLLSNQSTCTCVSSALLQLFFPLICQWWLFFSLKQSIREWDSSYYFNKFSLWHAFHTINPLAQMLVFALQHTMPPTVDEKKRDD